MSRNRNTYKNIPRNTDTRLTALAAPSAPCFILTPANPARAVSTVVAHSPIGKAGASALPLPTLPAWSLGARQEKNPGFAPAPYHMGVFYNPSLSISTYKHSIFVERFYCLCVAAVVTACVSCIFSSSPICQSLWGLRRPVCVQLVQRAGL